MMEILNKIKTLTNSEGLLWRCVRGGGILTAGSSVENLSRFVRNIILARLLAPEAFGLIATALAAVAVMEAFSEVGFRQSVIQNKDGNKRKFLNIIWWLSSLRGLILYGIGYFTAPIICDFYNQPELLLILRTIFLVILFKGLISPRVHVLEKNLQFPRWVIIMQGSGVLGVLIAIVSVFFLYNVWALVLGYISEALISCVLSFILCPFIPRFRVESAYLPDILRFSRRMFGIPILTMLFIRTDIFVIGKVLTLGQLGMYSLARNLAGLPNAFLSKIIQPLVLPALSSIQDDNDKLKDTLLIMTRVTATFGVPFIAFLAVFSKPILSLVYGSQYAAVAIPFSILCIYAMLFLSSTFIMNLYIAIGKPHIHRASAIVRTVLFLLMIYPATKNFGLTGASSSLLIAMCSSLAVQLIYLKKLINFRLYEYFNCWLRGLILSLFVIIPGILFNALFSSQGMEPIVIGILSCFIAWSLGAFKLGLFKHSLVVPKN